MLTLTSPGDSWLHRVPAGVKLALLAAGTVGLFQLAGIGPLAASFGAVMGLAASCGRRMVRAAMVLLVPLWPFALVLAVWHGISADLATGAQVALRVATAVTAANLVTMTTRLADMLAVIDAVLRPMAPLLTRLGVPPRSLALAMALVIRFIPVLADRLAQLRMAFAARSRRRPGWRIVTPAVLAALDDADHVAEALRARGGAG